MTPAVTAPHELRPALRAMLEELDAARLEVCVVPAPERRVHRWQGVRVVLQRNPAWYRDLAATYQRRRRVRSARFVDPRFKRADVAQVIRGLLSGGSRSYLAWPLLAVAEALHTAPEATHPWAAAPAHQMENFPYDLPAPAPATEARP